MKTCPKCKELVGDNVESCFNCNYNFILKRVPSYEETIELIITVRGIPDLSKKQSKFSLISHIN